MFYKFIFPQNSTKHLNFSNLMPKFSNKTPEIRKSYPQK